MTDTTNRPARRIALAPTNRATPGKCAVCGQSATQWHRSGRRATDADGITLAWRCCDEHERDAAALMLAVTIADLAAAVPPSRRVARAAGLRRKALVLRGSSRVHARASADLRGASSATHTHALISGQREMEADACEALADALAAP